MYRTSTFFFTIFTVVTIAENNYITDFFKTNAETKKSNGQNGLVETIKSDISNITKGLDFKDFAKNLTDFKLNLHLLYPGTKWCGPGNDSDSYNDLGTFSGADSCCRAHDSCPETIKTGSSKYGLTNKGFFRRSSCDCDQQFYTCLKKQGGEVANSIGCTYFTLLGPQCFANDYPIVKCEVQRFGRCVEYEKNQTLPKEYQWFDNPIYYPCFSIGK